MARAQTLDEALARVHLIRGNLLFPRGDVEGCLLEHEACLAVARRIGHVELQTAALGALGDAEYLRGRMVTARRLFGECVELAREQGLQRVEAANLPMAAVTGWYAGQSQDMLDLVEQGIRKARAIGHLRGEAIGHHTGFIARQALGEGEAARRHAEAALELARRLESPRLEAQALAFLGDLNVTRGTLDLGRQQLRMALALARSSGLAFLGPVILGLLGRTLIPTCPEHTAALDEAEALLATNGLAHNHLLFRHIAIGIAWAARDAAALRRHAQALEDFTRAEPLPWSGFAIRRARALADGLTQGWDDALRRRIDALVEEASRLGLWEDGAQLRAASLDSVAP